MFFSFSVFFNLRTLRCFNNKLYFSSMSLKNKSSNVLPFILLSSVDDKERFLSELKDFCLSLDKSHRLEFCLYLYTNDFSIPFCKHVAIEALSDNDYCDEDSMYLPNFDHLDDYYILKGYACLHSGLFDNKLVDVDVYVKDVYDTLWKYVLDINKYRKDGFVNHFKNTLVIYSNSRSKNSRFIKRNRINPDSFLGNYLKKIGVDVGRLVKSGRCWRSEIANKRLYSSLSGSGSLPDKPAGAGLSGCSQLSEKQRSPKALRLSQRHDSFVLFKQVKDILSNNPLNDDTQIKRTILSSEFVISCNHAKFGFLKFYSSFSNATGGLNKKLRVAGWVKLNYKDFNLINLRPNVFFIEKFFLYYRSRIITRVECGYEYRNEFQYGAYLYHELYYFKNNSLIIKKNYYLYLLNTPDNLVLPFVKNSINSYYLYIMKDYPSYEKKPNYKHDIISLYFNIGKELVSNCLKYMYSNYLKKNNIKVYLKGMIYKPFLRTNKEFFSFTEFKNILIQEKLYEMSTADFIEYGRDMYLFTIFNVYSLNLSESNSGCDGCTLVKSDPALSVTVSGGSCRVDPASLRDPLTSNVVMEGGTLETETETISQSCILELPYPKDRKSSLPIKIISPIVDTYINFFPSNNAILKARESYHGWARNFFGKRNKKRFSTSSAGVNLNTSNISFSSTYSAIVDILKSNDSNQTKQIQMENLLYDHWKTEVKSLLSKKSFLTNDSYSIKFITSELKRLEKDIYCYLNDRFYTDRHSYLKTIYDLPPCIILSIVLSLTIPFALKHVDNLEQPVTSLFKKVGEMLIRERANMAYGVIVKKHKKIMKDISKGKSKSNEMLDEIIPLPDFINSSKEFNLDEEDLIRLGLHFVAMISNNSNLIELKETRVQKEFTKRYLVTRDGLVHLLDHITLIDTEELPMVIKPYEWRINKKGEITAFGGSYLNHLQRFKPLRSKSIENISSKNMIFNQDIIDTVNKIASVEYCINKELLNIISSNTYYKEDSKNSPLLTLKVHDETTKLSYFVKNKDFIKMNEILSHNSKYLYDTSLLQLAYLMTFTEGFYLCVNIDWRGRLYTSSCILNIQGGELARSLLLFKDGDILTQSGLRSLKIYTANAFGLGKLSIEARLKWVEEHDVINSNNLWLKAEEPFLFLACTLELKGYYNNPKEFISRLPILLDATCNGLQHLSAMAQDITLAKSVNLLESKDNIPPQDLYSDLIEPIKESIDKLVKEKSIHFNLSKLNITRKLIKRGIMTITYGVTEYGILKQLMSDHFVKIGLKNKHYLYKPVDPNVGDVILNYNDLKALSESIYNSLFTVHPSLNEIMAYFQQMASLLNELNLSICWLTPYGLTIEQKYIKFTSYDITTNAFKKRYKVTLNKAAMNHEKEVIINLNKQKLAFVPNFVHSMDGSNIVFLIKSITNDYPEMNIVTIHDCFGCLANDADLMAQLVKESFISIYADRKFLEKFHDYIILTISSTYTVADNNVVFDSNKDDPLFIPIPDKPIIGDIDLSTQLRKSKYFIN